MLSVDTREPTMDTAQARALDALDARAVFGSTMEELARQYEDLRVVVSDYGRRLELGKLQAQHPDMVVQCGIAEQNQIEIASALANEGSLVFAASYAPFITARVLDQIRVNLGMMKSPVILVGLGGGFSSGELGTSHMGLEDIADLRAIPGISVIAPSDNAQLSLVLKDLARHPRPCYVRITTGHDAIAASSEGTRFDFGKARTLKAFDTGKPHSVAILATGTLAGSALRAAHQLADQSINICVAEVATIKPLDTAAIASLTHGVRLIVTVEEHSIIGGLGGAVAEYLAGIPAGAPLLRLGVPDTYLEADVQEHLLERCGLTADGIAQAINAALVKQSAPSLR